jgi:hypothetical protein
MLQLAEVVDETQTLTFLAEIHNHLPLFQSAVINMDTGEQGAPNPQHRMQVARRLELTPWQVRTGFRLLYLCTFILSFGSVTRLVSQPAKWRHTSTAA